MKGNQKKRRMRLGETNREREKQCIVLWWEEEEESQNKSIIELNVDSLSSTSVNKLEWVTKENGVSTKDL